MSIPALQSLLHDIDGLLVAGTLAAAAWERPKLIPPGARTGDMDSYTRVQWSRAVQGVNSAADGLRSVRRISYASPLEITLWATAVSGAITGAGLAAREIVKLYMAAQEARISHHRADAFTAAYDAVADALDMRPHDPLDIVRDLGVSDETADVFIGGAIHRAVRVLEKLESAQLLNGDGSQVLEP